MGEVSSAEKVDMARPLCSTCTYHEVQSQRINIMWGGLKVAAAVAITAFGIVTAMIFRNTEAITINSQKIAQHEREMTASLTGIDRALSIISMNQKRQMIDMKLPYIDPEKSIREN